MQHLRSKSVFMNMSVDFQTLVDGCCRNDHSSQKALYEAFAPMMMGVCIRYMGSREEAQDVLQDAFVKVFEKIHTLRQAQAVEDWVYHIVVRTALNSLRKKKLEFEDITEQEINIAYNDYDIDYLLSALNQLTDTQRTVFNLHEVEGYDFGEISKLLNIPEVTLRSILFRSRKKLQTILQEHR